MCRVGTRWASAEPIPSNQVERYANALAFEQFYEEWERKRVGPTPEELGRRDAREELDRRKKGKGD